MSQKQSPNISLAADLRLGNLVCSPLADRGTRGIARVTGLQQNSAMIENINGTEAGNQHNAWIALSDLSPIALGQETLASTGFNFSNVHLWYEDESGFVICHHKDGSFYCPFIQEIDPPLLRQVHELQNLYFSLTGSELNFKPADEW